MPENISITAGIASRYATAIFEISREEGDLDTLEADVKALRKALGDSEDLRTLINSPVYARDEMERAIAAVGERMKLGQTVRNAVSVMALKRRLFALPVALDRIDALISDHKGVARAEVISAERLTEQQMARLAEMLSKKAGKTVELEVSVDASLIGGLVAKLGSRMVDCSTRTILSNLKDAMQEAR